MSLLAALVLLVTPPAPEAGRSTQATASEPRADTDRTKGMVWIPGGEFRMGSTDPLARADEQPVHRVRVRGFWMDATEVTSFAATISFSCMNFRIMFLSSCAKKSNA